MRQNTMLPVGTRVRLTAYRLASIRQTDRGFHYLRGPERDRAEERLAAETARRGTITEVINAEKASKANGWNPRGGAYAITWDNGGASKTTADWIEEDV